MSLCDTVVYVHVISDHISGRWTGFHANEEALLLEEDRRVGAEKATQSSPDVALRQDLLVLYDRHLLGVQ